MSTGARSTEQWREHRALLEAIQRGGPAAVPEPAPAPVAEVALEEAIVPRLQRIGAIVLVAVGLLWLAAVVTAQQTGAGPLGQIAAAVSLASGPLALLGIAYLLLQRTSQREAQRFGQTASAMRHEAAALDETIARLAARIDDSRKAVAEHAQELLSLGEDSVLRLSEIGTRMRGETTTLGRQADRLEAAAAAAFTDMGVMMADVPRVESQVHALAATLRDTGRDAAERTATLTTELATLADRAREVDEVAGGAAQRLSAHLARIESISDSAGGRIDAAAAGIARTVDTALTSAADAVDATRASVETQSAALLAMVDQSKAAFGRAGGDAADSLESRLATITGTVDRIGTGLGEHDVAARAMLDMLAERIDGIDRALAETDLNGTARATLLADRLHALGEDAAALGSTIDRGNKAVEGLIGRGERLHAVITDCAADLGERLPALIAQVEADATRGGDSLDAMLPRARALSAELQAVDDRLGGQRERLQDIGAAAADQLAALADHARLVEAAVEQASEQAKALAGSAGPLLVEALLRVRETAMQAADHAARAFGEVIQSAAARLGEESRAALDGPLSAAIEDKLAAIATASERAVVAATDASRRLTDEMTAIAATTSAVGKQAVAVALPPAGEGMSTRVAELIEHLNATGIDVARLLASDIPDTLWAAYLKGDHGVFTRRAARLIEESEVKSVAQRYDADPNFHDRVDRYIRDFEAMLGHVLATRDGSLLGVILLSADMGKLYVALALAIQRLRP